MANNSKEENSEYVPAYTGTTSPPTSYQEFIPTLIPALQSSAYILVILGLVAAWLSRGFFSGFLTKHLELMTSLQENLGKLTENIDQLTENNKTLTNSLDRCISAVSKDKT